MNERYLYRGKTKPDGEWIYGGHMYVESLDRHIIVEHDGCKQFSDECFGFSAVIPETVGQCTGLKDKNGNWIFEGDIVKFKKFKDEYIGTIFFKDISAAFEIQSKIVVGAYGEKAIYSQLLCHCDAIEVIGYKWDNPELLEV